MPVGSHLADEIAAWMVDEGLGVGVHLRTIDLARRFAVSRWPVEQALKRLVTDGAVEHRPNKGFFVAQHRTVAPGRLVVDPVHEAYLAASRDLIEGHLPSQVSENQVRDRYGLTRAQTGALFGRLQREGLAEKRPGYGWQFSAFLTTPRALEHTYQLRLMIEPAALESPGYSLPGETLARLRRTEHELLAGSIETLAPDALFEKAAIFHEELIKGAGNPFLVETLRRMNRVRRLLVYRSMDDRRRYFGQSEEHLQILDAIENRRMDDAAALMRSHLLAVMGRLQAIGILDPTGPADREQRPGKSERPRRTP